LRGWWRRGAATLISSASRARVPPFFNSWSIQHVRYASARRTSTAWRPSRTASRNAAAPSSSPATYREAEGLSIAQIAQRLGRSPATVKAYLYDPTGEKAKAVKARYQGICRGCGAPTQPRNGKGDAYAYCKNCHPGAIAPKWTRERVREAMRAWQARNGTPPSSYDWSRGHARGRGGDALARLAEGDWPAPGTVTDLYGTWAAAHADAFGLRRPMTAIEEVSLLDPLPVAEKPACSATRWPSMAWPL
jgi:sigma-70-like protein